jgi:hypothetical protein
MKKLVLLSAIAVAGCNPVPMKRVCGMPDFSATSGLKVEAKFATWGYFSERCTIAMPKSFVVSGREASLSVLIDGEWLRLSAQDHSGQSLPLAGKTLRHGGTNARIDEQTDNVFQANAVSADGARIEQFRLPFTMQTCTCVLYDAL